MAKSWESVNPKVSSNNDRFKLEDYFDLVEKEKLVKKFHDFRFLGDLTSYQVVWIPIFKDGKPILSKKTNKQIEIPKFILNWNPDTEEIDDSKSCPYTDYIETVSSYVEKRPRVQTTYMANAIYRKLVETRPRRMPPITNQERKTHFKSLDSESWTPVRVFAMPPTLTSRIKNTMELNTIKTKDGGVKAMSISHPKFGCDIHIKFDPDAAGSNMYEVNKGERTPLSEEEQQYLIWDLSVVTKHIDAIDIEQAERDVEFLRKSLKSGSSGFKKSSRTISDDDDDDIEDLGAVSKSSKKKKKALVDDDLDDDLDDVLDAAPVKSKKKKPPVDDDDDDLDDDDTPPVKSKKKKAPAKDDDDDLDDLDSDEDEDIDTDDEDDEDEPPVKKKSSKPTLKKKRPPVDEDEDDEDDEDEPPVKKKSSKPGLKKKRRPSDDDDDDDIPF